MDQAIENQEYLFDLGLSVASFSMALPLAFHSRPRVSFGILFTKQEQLPICLGKEK